MKNTLVLSLILLVFSLSASADTIIFRDGMRIDAPNVWEENGEVKCEISGIVFGYPKADVVRIDKGRNGAKKETVIPEREASINGETKTAPQKAASNLKKKKAVTAKEILANKKAIPPQAILSQDSSIPSFKEIINEDDSNRPVYIKRRRVLLVSRGLAKAQVRALLLSYENKLRNELKAQKARYKLIVVWVYDDFSRAGEGAAGWVGMISNGQKTGELSEEPELIIP